MAVPDPLTIDVDQLPPALPASWLDGSLPDVIHLGREDAAALATDVVAYHSVQVARHGRWKRSTRTSKQAFALLMHYADTGLPREARKAVAYALGVVPALEARDRADVLAQGIGFHLAKGLTPTVPHHAARRRVSDRTVQQLLRYPVVAQRVEATERFWNDATNMREVDPRALARRFRSAVPHPRDLLPLDTPLRVIAAMKGNAAQKAAARVIAYGLVTHPGEPIGRPALLATAYALGIKTHSRRVRGAW